MRAKIKKIIKTLDRLYPKPKPFLKHRTPYELLVAVILSAQCTDARVNTVTPALFRAANTPEKMARLGVKRLIPYIRSCGFYNQKAKAIVAASRSIIRNHCGRVPKTLNGLIKLHGVGRKTASVVVSQAFGVPSFPVDTHVYRVSHRLDISRAKTPDKTDLDLRKTFPKKYWVSVHLQMIMHGRALCAAKNPKCPQCPLLSICPEGKRRTKR